MFPKRLVVLAVVVLAMGTVGCGAGDGPASDGIGLEWSLQPSPPQVGEAEFICTVWDSVAGAPVTNASFEIEGNMAHAGMQPVFSSAREVAPGRYAATISFTMAGDWFLLVDVRTSDGRTVHRQVDVKGVRPR